MREYLIEISLEAQQEISKAIASLLKCGLRLDKAFTPKKLNISSTNNQPLKNNYLIKGYLLNTDTLNLLGNCTVANVWKNNGYIPF